MNIVSMEERHLPALAAIERACFHAPWSENALREELGSGIFLVAEMNGAAVGYVGCQTVMDEGYITNVATLPEYRRKGVGWSLVGALLSRAWAAGLSFVTLEVRASNAPAIALYEGLGFARVGVRRGFYNAPKEDAVLMTRYKKEKAE